jgi:hypothetical protein
MSPRRLLLPLLLLCCARCSCTPPTDDERLRERLDALKVHLYLGLKVAAAGDPANEDIASARRLLVSIDPAHRAQGPAQQVTVGDVFNDTVALTRALLALRALGLAEFAHFPGSTDDSLFLREALRAADAATDVDADADALDAPTLRAYEHAVLTLLLVVAKVHPRTPTPIPVEFILYEARATDAARIDLEPLQQMLRGARAYTYGSEDFCDLASADTSWLTEHPVPVDPDVVLAIGRGAAHSGEAALLLAGMVALPPALQLAAHGSTAACFHGRDDIDAMNVEVQRMVDLAVAWGVPDTEVAVVRAYLAYQHGDLDETRRQLELADASVLLDEQGRAELRELREGLTTNPGLLEGYYNKAFFVTWAIRVSVHRLEQAGAFDALAQTPAFVRVRGIVDDARVAAEHARERLPEAPSSVDDVTRRFGCGASP